MKSRLPQLFNTSSSDNQQQEYKKKQGGIFQLNLSSKIQHQDLNATFTSGFAYTNRNNKSSSCSKRQSNKFIKAIQPSKQLYKTLILNTQRYSIPKQQKLFNIYRSQIKSVKARQFSLDKNPQTCLSWHENQQSENINSIILNRKYELSEIEHKMTPFKFVANQYREELKRIKNTVEKQINTIQSQFTRSIMDLKNTMSLLRKQTKSQIKVSKIDIQKYTEELVIYKQMADDFDSKIENIKKTL